MRNPERIKRIIEKFYDAWRLSPDLRFGQLLVNLIGDNNLFYTEDDKLECELDKWLEKESLNFQIKENKNSQILRLIEEWKIEK